MAAAAATPTPSPTADRAAPSSPSPPEHPASALAPSARRLAPPCWGQEETLALIDAYRDKWHELRRGNLRASHWQQVADAVRRRCPPPSAAAAKTAVQCRHKVEKLRQRYRAEKQRLALRGTAGKQPRPPTWPFFPHMDAVELIAASPPPSSDGRSNSDGAGGNPKKATAPKLGLHGLGGGAGLEFRIPKALRSKPKPGNGGFSKGGFSRPLQRRSAEERKHRGLVWEMAAAVKLLGEEFARVEEMKMAMARDVEQLRREMEVKRTELIVRSHLQIVDCIRGLRDKERAEVVAPNSKS